MPTGYTAGIIDGKISDFKSFATQCTRAFGATIHMRDDSWDKAYEPRVPSDYYKNSIDTATAALDKLHSLSDENLLKDEKKWLQKEISRCKKAINQIKKNRIALGTMLADAIIYEAPTEDHNGFKKFMQEQLTDTIKGDGNPRYYLDLIRKYELELNSLDAKEIRKKRDKQHIEDIKYYTQQLTEETERCDKANKWMEDFFNSIN